MTTYFITRHTGALEWAKARGIKAQMLSHLDPASIKPGDRVIGTLPVHIAAEICARGAYYLHLSITIPEHARGRELTADEMGRFGAKIKEYRIQGIPDV
jgi:CRISPR-associated protein Csx16